MRLGFPGLIFVGLTAFSVIASAQVVAPRAPSARPASSVSFPSRVLRQTTFNIPFTVDTAQPPLEVQLHLSRDAGQSWKLYARQNPSARYFPFHAKQDGEYWFASQSIDGNRTSVDIAGCKPELHVIIDTVQPEFEFQAVIGPSREIQVSWRCSDATIDPASLKIEYQSGREQPWQPIATGRSTATNSTVSGRVTFRPRTAWVQLQIRAEISDLARNKTIVNRRLSLPTGGQPQPQPNFGQRVWRPVAARSTNQQEHPVALPPTTGFGPATADSKPPNSSVAAGVPTDPYANAHFSGMDDPPTSELTTAPRRSDSNEVAPTREWKSISHATPGAGAFEGPGDYQIDRSHDPLVPGSEFQPQSGPVRQFVSQDIASAEQSARPDLDATTPSTLRADSNRVSLLRMRMTSAMQFELDYEIDAAAANGVRSVELWGTRDKGQTWSRWQVDADRQSPLDVRVDAEGTYGFRIVIVGNNGLAGDAPRNGDDADLWVGVDTTAPIVEITTATYGVGEHAGQLDIRWRASDASFGERPMSILFSDKATGPWTTIAVDIPNSGRYFWPIDPRAPEQLYLRMEARDLAGNKGEYRLPASINLAGFIPKARIRGIRPLRSSPVSNPYESDSSPHAARSPFTFR
jgi:hypothetical protein